jgi:protein-disulfide isomerase
MSVKLCLSALLAACLFAATAPAPKKTALDKPTMEAYVRHLFVLQPQVKVEIGNPKPSELPGFQDVTATISNGQWSQNVTFYVSKDGQKIVQGNVFDVNQNPFKKELDKLKTQFEPSFGTPGAPVVIVEFTDFECPYCKEEAKVLRDNIKTAYPTQVRLYFKNFPLETIHPWSKAAAIAGRCVFQQSPSLFWDYHDWMFEHQGDINANNLSSKVQEWAKGKEIDALQLNRCMETKATEADVDRNIAEGKELGVNATPTLFINGRRLPGASDWPTLRSVIDYEIEYQKTAHNAGEDCGCEVKPPSPLLGK